MSMDFTTQLVGPPGDLAQVLEATSTRLMELGMRRSSEYFRVAFEPERGVYDEMETDEVITDYKSADHLRQLLAGWQGAAATFQGEHLYIYVMVCVAPEKATWSWVDITDRKLSSLGRADEENQFYAALGAVAAGCEARAGFGNMEMPFEPVSVDQALAYIFSFPGFEDEPSDFRDPSSIGLIARDAMDEKTLRERAAGGFLIRPWSIGYWLLEERAWYLSAYFNKDLGVED